MMIRCQQIGKATISHNSLSMLVIMYPGSTWRINFQSMALYANARDLKDAIKRWATLTLQMQFRLVKSSPSVYDVCCLMVGCSFRVHTYKGRWKDYQEVISVENHTCHNLNKQTQATEIVANYMYSEIVSLQLNIGPNTIGPGTCKPAQLPRPLSCVFLSGFHRAHNVFPCDFHCHQSDQQKKQAQAILT